MPIVPLLKVIDWLIEKIRKIGLLCIFQFYNKTIENPERLLWINIFVLITKPPPTIAIFKFCSCSPLVKVCLNFSTILTRNWNRAKKIKNQLYSVSVWTTMIVKHTASGNRNAVTLYFSSSTRYAKKNLRTNTISKTETTPVSIYTRVYVLIFLEAAR